MTRIEKRHQAAAALQSASREMLTSDLQFLTSGSIRVISVIRGSELLLVAEGFDGIESGGFARRIKTEEDADSRAEQECYRD
jgi:hypothetical protein